MRTVLASLSLLGGLFLTLPAVAATRQFTASLTQTPTCGFTSANGTATFNIDDATGAVRGTLRVSGFDQGGTISSAGIYDTTGGETLAANISGFIPASPNETHTITATVSAATLPNILNNKGVVIVKSSFAGCTNGALKGDLKGPAGGSSSSGGTDAGGGGSDDAGETGGGTTTVTESGCAVGHLPERSATGLGFVLATAGLVLARRRRTDRRA